MVAIRDWSVILYLSLFFSNASAPTVIYTLSLHDALPISPPRASSAAEFAATTRCPVSASNPQNSCPNGHEFCRSEEHTSELQSRLHLVCRLLLEKKNYELTCGVASDVWVVQWLYDSLLLL